MRAQVIEQLRFTLRHFSRYYGFVFLHVGVQFFQLALQGATFDGGKLAVHAGGNRLRADAGRGGGKCAGLSFGDPILAVILDHTIFAMLIPMIPFLISSIHVAEFERRILT
jgi:hypothetical protein